MHSLQESHDSTPPRLVWFTAAHSASCTWHDFDMLRREPAIRPKSSKTGTLKAGKPAKTSSDYQPGADAKMSPGGSVTLQVNSAVLLSHDLCTEKLTEMCAPGAEVVSRCYQVCDSILWYDKTRSEPSLNHVDQDGRGFTVLGPGASRLMHL